MTTARIEKRYAAKNNFQQLIEKISGIHVAMQHGAVYAVNQYLSVRNWLFGYHIVEFEQNGTDRAKYGEKLIDELSKSLKDKGIKGVAPTPLRLYRNFYLKYPQIQPTVSIILQSIGFQDNISLSIQPTLSVESEYAIIYKEDLPPELLLSRLSFSGQMNLYLNYFKKNEMAAGDNPPVGIILCKDKDETLVEYSTADMSENLFVSKYLLKLPDKKVLEKIIKNINS